MNTSVYSKLMIGKVDSQDRQIKNGDKLEVLICKASATNREEVKHIGIVVFFNMAYCLQTNDGKIHPLCNYAPNCQFTKLN